MSRSVTQPVVSHGCTLVIFCPTPFTVTLNVVFVNKKNTVVTALWQTLLLFSASLSFYIWPWSFCLFICYPYCQYFCLSVWLSVYLYRSVLICLLLRYYGQFGIFRTVNLQTVLLSLNEKENNSFFIVKIKLTYIKYYDKILKIWIHENAEN